jgi:NADH-quinone oxidoreductase subunit L
MGKGGGRVLGAFDRTIVDGGVNGAGWLTRVSARISMWWDTWIVDGAVRFSSFLVKMLSYPVCILQTGRVQAYAFAVVIGAIAFLGYYIAH